MAAPELRRGALLRAAALLLLCGSEASSTDAQEELDLREELTRGAWYEPPLIMSRGFNEPPRVFRHYLESSTASRHNPAVPVLHWKPGTRL